MLTIQDKVGTTNMAERTPDVVIDDAVRLYDSGMPMKQIGATLAISYNAVRNGLIRRGVQLRERHSIPRVRTLDHEFFHCIDTEEKAYWLGFIMADGCVQNKYKLSILLASCDVGHLRKFAIAVGSDAPISHRRVFSLGAWRDTHTIQINGIRFVDGLLKHGVCPRKSHNGFPCLLDSDDLQRHYWRGMFDGDGCITATRYPDGRLNGYGAQFCGNGPIVHAFADFIRERSSHPMNVKPKDKQFFVQFRGVGELQKSLSVLYRDATVYLDRKYSLYLKLMEMPVRRRLIA